METYSDNWNACLLFRNKQLTKQLKNYQEASVLADCSSSLLLAMSQLLRLHQHPSYGDRKSTRLNSSHRSQPRMPSSA